MHERIDPTDWQDLLRGRRSIRKYLPRAVADKQIALLLECARWAPSAHNRQPWRFAIITRHQTKEKLARAMGERLQGDLEADGLPQDAIQVDVERSYRRISSAPLLILLSLSMLEMDSYGDSRRRECEHTMAVQSVAMAGQNLLLTAHLLGLGACWMCAPLFCPEVVSEVLALPTDWEPQGLVTVGYPAETRQKARRPIEELILNY